MNRTKLLFQIPSLGLLVVTVLFFQNCSGRMFADGQLNSGEFASVDPQKLFEGQKLYAQNCALCHGDVNTSEKRGRSASQIKTAMGSVANMLSLRLTDDEVSSIALALRSNFSGPAMCANPTDVGRVVAHRLNKRELSNSLRDLFGFPFATEFAKDMPDDNSGETFDNDAMSLFSDVSYADKLLQTAYYVVDQALSTRRSSVVSACTATTDNCARQILRGYSYRAYRRPVTAADDNRVFNIYKQARDEGDSYDEGLRQGLVAIIVSPQFMFRVVEHPNHRDPGLTVALNGHDMASRLAYFIWGSLPDGALLTAAQGDQLRSGEQIAAQVKRMMADERAVHVVQALADQWLEMKKLKTKSISYAGFSEALRTDMGNETRMAVQKIFAQDLPLSTLLTANTSFVNARLAAHYGVSGFSGTNSTFRETNLGPLRQGILSHASVLTLTSHSTETSIVGRGKYVLKNILCDMPPPPPAGVINPPGSEQDRSNLRMTNPTCVACHSRIDPIGIGLQNYDAIGGYRTTDEYGASINASGTLPGGQTFSGAIQLAGMIANDDRAKVCATRKIMNLALGRSLQSADDCVVNRIAIKEDAFGQPVSKLIEAIALSDEFRHQRGEAP
ncbi:MAG: DUF1592 domain-containing protein [Bdellovibrionaceae bacterium]|nr:DUF1592 domain-containing protein [Pseudobdellovibrionaceae bacterium]